MPSSTIIHANMTKISIELLVSSTTNKVITESKSQPCIQSRALFTIQTFCWSFIYEFYDGPVIFNSSSVNS